MIAASIGNANIIHLLLDAGADRTMQNGEGKTAADIAREKDHAQIADLLSRPVKLL